MGAGHGLGLDECGKGQADRPEAHSAQDGPSDAVSEQRASEILGVSRKTLRNWRSQGHALPYLKYGGRNGLVRYVMSELLAWRNAHRRGRT